MEQFFQINIGQIAQVVIVLIGVVVMFQKVRDDIKNQGARLVNVETELAEVRKIMIAVARQDERMNAMDQRMLAQGTRIDSTATILNGRLEAINNIISGHTAQLNNVSRGAKVG
jgi:small-conductance mechanosensitive channel